MLKILDGSDATSSRHICNKCNNLNILSLQKNVVPQFSRAQAVSKLRPITARMPSGSGGILNKRLKFVELIELLNTFTKVFLLVNTSYKDLTTLVIFFLNVDKQKPMY